MNSVIFFPPPMIQIVLSQLKLYRIAIKLYYQSYELFANSIITIGKNSFIIPLIFLICGFQIKQRLSTVK